MGITYESIKQEKNEFSSKVSFLVENRELLENRDYLINIFTCSTKSVYILPKEVNGSEVIKITSDTLFDLDDLLHNPIVAVPKDSPKEITFPKEEIPQLETQNKIITTRILNEKDKFKMGEIVRTPWGDLFSVIKVLKPKRLEDHQYYNELSEPQKKLIGTHPFDLITLEKIKTGKKYLCGTSFYIYGVAFKSISHTDLPLNDVLGKKPGVIILVKLSEDGTVPIYNPQDCFMLSSGMIENYTDDKSTIETTVGRFLMNYLLFIKPFGKIFPYKNEVFNVGKIDDMVARALLNKTIDRTHYDKYMAYGFFIGQFSELCVPGLSRKSLTTDPKIKTLRATLLEENKDKLNDPTVLTHIESQLIEVDKQWIKGDSSEDFYAVTAGKSYKEHRKKMFLTMGLAEAFQKNNNAYTFIPGSLSEGWDPKHLPEIANEVRRGSYDRGKNTAKGGEQTKFLLRIFQNLRITADDCKTTTGMKITLTDQNYKTYLQRYIVNGQKTILLTENNITSYLNKEVIIRSAMYCKTPDGLCYACAGESFKQLNSTAIGMLALDIGSRFTSISMKSMHFSGISTTKITSLKPFFF